jgi:hypothetical protein
VTVYVDEMRPVWPRRWGFRFREHCHMMAEGDKELEDMARRLQLPNRWRDGDHYDLVGSKRQAAIKQGAIAISTREMVCFRKKRRAR